MDISKSIFTFALVFLSLSLSAQVKEIKKANKTANEANSQATELDTTLQTTKQTIASLKGTLNGLFGSKGKKETVIGFSGIEFGDDNLSLLYDEFRGMKDVKNVSKNLNQGMVNFQINSKKGAVHLWENLPINLKSLFKVTEANEEGMMVQYRKPADPEEED